MFPLDKLHQRQNKTNSLLCIGLDPDFSKISAQFSKLKFPQFEFNKWIIEQTHEYALAYKPNTAFYEARGSQGWKELEMTMEYLHKNHPDIFTIADAKRGDIGSTNQGYVTAIFDHLGFDAVTIHPFTGSEGLSPFLERQDKVSIVLCHTSNPGAKELQEMRLQTELANDDGIPLSTESRDRDDSLLLWQIIAEKVVNDWNKNKNCMLVVGATFPEELKKVREIVGDMWLLIPGIGSQGGDLDAVLENGLTAKKDGVLINASRSIIFAESPKDEAENLVRQMQKLL